MSSARFGTVSAQPKGTSFVRYATAKALGGDALTAKSIAMRWQRTNPEIIDVLNAEIAGAVFDPVAVAQTKTAVNAGTTSDQRVPVGCSPPENAPGCVPIVRRSSAARTRFYDSLSCSQVF